MKSRSGAYSGYANFNYQIVRFLKNGILTDEETNSDILTIDLDIYGSAYYDPGVWCGPTDNWQPPEGDVNIESALDKNGKDWKHELTDSEIEEIDEIIIDRCSDYY